MKTKVFVSCCLHTLMILGFANGEAAEGYFTVCNINKTGEFSMFIILGRLDAVYKETGQKLSKY